jgi:hypothetical protein
MNFPDSNMTYQVWAADNVIYGPVDLPTLIQWVREGRVQNGTWVFSAFDGAWHEASAIPELGEHLTAAENAEPQEGLATGSSTSIAPAELRQFSIFAGLSDDQLGQFLAFGEHCRVVAREWFLKKGDPGDALFFVLEGSVRVRLQIGRDDRTLSVIPAGQFFGEMAMFNRAPRSADVVAESDARLFRLSAESFVAMTRDNPALAAPILFALAGAMAARVSEANQQLQREVVSGFVWG